MPQTGLKEVRNIKYLSKDFDSIKFDLIEFIKQNFPNDFQDFNEASGGMALLEMLAYVGDLMSFYIDRQANEGFMGRAVEEKNIFGLSKTLGRKPKFSIPASTNFSLSAVFNDATSAAEFFTIRKGTRVSTTFEPSVSFELIEDVDFSISANRSVTSDGTFVTASVSSISGIAGASRTFVYTVGAASPFLKITLPDEDITEITSVSSSDGNEWSEVDYLAQDTIFVGDNNDTSSSASVPYVLKMKRVPYRFTQEPEPTGVTSIRFGSGKLSLEDSEIIPNPEDFVLPATLRGSASGFCPSTINSGQFLNTRTLGVAPSNVSLDITYRYGGGLDTNVGSNTVTRYTNLLKSYKTTNFESISAEAVDLHDRTLKITNTEQASGGAERETLDEMRENASAFFSAQNRAVTLQDYQILTMSMPATFGTVFRTYARKDPSNNLGVELITIARDTDGYLVSTNGTVKNNIEKFIGRFKSFSDTVKITDGKIVNLTLDFSIVPELNVNANDALLEAFFLLRRELDISNSNFGTSIVKTDIQAKLQNLEKVRSVASLSFGTRTNTVDGRSYSNVQYDVVSNTSNGIITFPPDIIWECKYLDFDITGRTV
jgi:hypothetical protein